MQSLIDIIEVDDRKIRIKGSKDVLEKAVVASQNGQARCSQMSTKWRTTIAPILVSFLLKFVSRSSVHDPRCRD
jgi:hypothetical protein